MNLKPADLLVDLETGDRTLEHLKRKESIPGQGLNQSLINQLQQSAGDQISFARYGASSQMGGFYGQRILSTILGGPKW